MNRRTTTWTFFSNHGHVYFLLATYKEITIREMATRVGLTERRILGIIQDLEDSEFIKKEKKGRSNVYSIVKGKTLRHPLEKDVLLKDLTSLIKKTID